MQEGNKQPNDERKVRFRQNQIGSKDDTYKWVIKIAIVAFFLSAAFSFISTNLLTDINVVLAFLVLLFIIFIGIIFDIIGIAVTAADETPFHAMASRKYYGARQAIKLIRNANKVSSFCNDVVGDICGIISGAASALIIIQLPLKDAFEVSAAGIMITGLVASLTIGGKAIGKTIALEKSNYIIYRISVIIQFISAKINIRKK